MFLSDQMISIDNSNEKDNSKHNMETNFNEFLRKTFIDRMNTIDDYSLRNFAKDLGIHFASLSRMISGKRSISRKSILHIGEKLRLSEQQINFYLDQFQINKLNRRKKIRTIQFVQKFSLAELEKVCFAIDQFKADFNRNHIQNVNVNDAYGEIIVYLKK